MEAPAPGACSWSHEQASARLPDGLPDGLQDGLPDGLQDGLEDGLQDGLQDGLGLGAAGHLERQIDDVDTHSWTWRPLLSLEPAAGAMSRQLHDWGQDWDCWSLHTAGLTGQLGLGCPTAQNGTEGLFGPDPGWNRLGWAGIKMCRCGSVLLNTIR
jgi:hypothetical protein